MGSTSRRLPIEVDGTSFALNGENMSYRFHVNPDTGDLEGDHFGGSVDASTACGRPDTGHPGWSGKLHRTRREFPDLGRGDFRTPAFLVRQGNGGTAISDLQYQSHEVLKGRRREVKGLPGLFGGEGEVDTLVIRMADKVSGVVVELGYSVFPRYDAVVRNVTVIHSGEGKPEVYVEKLASFSVDLEEEELEMIGLKGDWAREGQRIERKIDVGTQGFGSTTGFSSHLHNPFLGLKTPTTTESRGDAWGFSFIYTGSFNVEVEKNSQGLTRVLMGEHPAHMAQRLNPGEQLSFPECVAIYSSEGVGGMSRRFHKLYRKHLVRGKFADTPRPVLLNSWEGVYFDFDAEKMYQIAEHTAALGVKLLVMDDGWFGERYPRVSDKAGLGDWIVNPERFPKGLDDLAARVRDLDVAGSSEKLQFGVWVEPEMVQVKSKLFEDHPNWVLQAEGYASTETRNQLVLDLGQEPVQDYIIDAIGKILESGKITYIKWDNNRGMHEMPSPNASRKYMEGLYRVLDALITRFPDVLFEGCASGGGRFDPGILQYFPQSWTSDDTDAVERIRIQFGTSLVYPASSMGAHISAVPNHITSRTTPFKFRAHVAMMGGSFGFELDPADLSDEEKKAIPEFIATAERIGPIIIKGDMYRLRLPEHSSFPAAMFVAEDGSRAVLFCFQTKPNFNAPWPFVKLQGLDPAAKYKLDGGEIASGATLMNMGVQYSYKGEYDSKLVILERQ